jgi:hypothetical protein
MYVLGVSGDDVTLRAGARQAGILVYAAQDSQIWLVLREPRGSTQRKPPVIGPGGPDEPPARR